MKPRTLVFLFLGILTILRLVYIGQIELSPDEAYYYMWSERPDISYYSKGPGVAMAIRLGTALFGANEFGIRFLSPLLALGTSLLIFFFARRLYNETVGFWAVVAINLIPIFQAGGLVMTIDPLSIFFWTAAVFTFWLALEQSPDFNFYWPVTGLLIGFGFLAKYTNAALLASILLLLALTPKYRKELLRPGFYTLLLGFAVCTLPPIIWNSKNEWITVAHISARGGLDSAFSLHPKELLEFLAAHFGVYSPLIFLGMLITLGASLQSMKDHWKARFLLFFSLPLLVLYFALSLKQAGEANWTAPAFVTLGILSAAFWYEAAQSSTWKRGFAVAALAVGLFMSLGTLNFDLLRKTGAPIPYDKDPSARLYGWETAAETIEKFRKEFEQKTGSPVFLIGNKYQTSAILSFYLNDPRIEGPGHPAVYIPESQNIENQFSFWPRYDEFIAVPKEKAPTNEVYTEEQGINPFMGRTALYITDREEEKPPTSIKNGFESVEPLVLFQFSRNNQPLRTIRIFACYQYKSIPL